MDLDVLSRYPDNKLVIATTGSQGEPMSALTRMAMNDHRKITVTPNDFIILSGIAHPRQRGERHPGDQRTAPAGR